MKKGFYFSFDAFLAIFLLLTGLFIVLDIPDTGFEPGFATFEDAGVVAEDYVSLLSTREFENAFNSSYRGSVVEETGLESSEFEGSVLEVVGSLVVHGEEDVAENVLETFFEDFEKDGYGFSVVFGEGEDSTTVYSTEEGEDSRDVLSSSSRMVSGVEMNRSTRGYTASASVSEAGTQLSEYFFFGNYVGEGNLTGLVELPSDVDVSSVDMELSASDSFDLFVNGEYVESFTAGGQGFYPEKYDICNSESLREDLCYSLDSGENSFELVFGEEGSVSGGFIRVDYQGSFFLDELGSEGTGSKKVDVPGIDGVINFYSSAFVPENLEHANLDLRFTSDHPIFVSLGGETVYEGGSEEGYKEVEMGKEDIDEGLEGSLESFEGENLPFRIGMSNVSELEGRYADVFSVVDVSGSMGACDVPGDEDDYDCQNSCENYDLFCCWMNDCDTESGCESCDGDFMEYGRERINVAKEVSKDFIDIVLNVSGNRVGLNAYESTVSEDDVHELSRDHESLYDTVDGWEASGGTCICCGVEDATTRMLEDSDPSNYRSMVVMSDGVANQDCYGGDPAQEAIDSACEAYEEHGIEVYTIGFGPTSEVDQETLREMAECGQGEYYYATVAELEEVYSRVSEDILMASYEEQYLEVREGELENVSLDESSHLSFEYDEETGERSSFGRIPMSFESDTFGDEVNSPKNGSFYVPEGSEPSDVRLISYSSRYWLDRVLYEDGGWNYLFRLDSFGDDYESLGAPFRIGVPSKAVSYGWNNFSVDTGSSWDERAGGSPSSRFVYDLNVDGVSGYGDVFERAEGGCRTVETRFDSFELCVGNQSDEWDPENDAVNDAFERLLDSLDVNDDGLVDFRLDEEDFTFEDSVYDGLSWLWGPSKVSVEVWRE